MGRSTAPVRCLFAVVAFACQCTRPTPVPYYNILMETTGAGLLVPDAGSNCTALEDGLDTHGMATNKATRIFVIECTNVVPGDLRFSYTGTEEAAVSVRVSEGAQPIGGLRGVLFPGVNVLFVPADGRHPSLRR